ncbi:MAG: SCO family protein [Hyphomicrobiaceae bacterium]|nr:SCO family protein [Hyphomicrobiaceae bacterium]
MAAQKSTLGTIRLILWAAVGVAVLAGGLILSGELARTGPGLPGAARIGGPFVLTSHTGQRFSSERLAGKPYMLFFGFTHCPDICPTTLHEVSKHLEALGPAADNLTVLFVTVDPERDTQELLSQYLSAFDKRIIGLTGTAEEIAQVTKAYRAIYEKVATTGEDYTMNHTATVYLFDAGGRLRSTLTWQEPEETRMGKLKKLLAG